VPAIDLAARMLEVVPPDELIVEGEAS